MELSSRCYSQFRKEKNPELYIIGENHWNRDSTLEQAKIIYRMAPEYLLLESLGERRPEDTEDLVGNFKHSRMDFLTENLGIKIEERIVERYKKEFHEKCKSNDIEKCLEFHWIPGSVEELMKFPAYALHEVVLDVLSEEYNIPFDKFNSSPEISKLSIQLCAAGHVGSKVAGCDSSELFKEQAKCLLRVEDIYNGLLEIKRKKSEEIKRKRDRYMGKKMIEYIEKRETGKPVLAIVGRAHADETSAIHEVLNNEGIRYSVLLDKVIT